MRPEHADTSALMAEAYGAVGAGQGTGNRDAAGQYASNGHGAAAEPLGKP